MKLFSLVESSVLRIKSFHFYHLFSPVLAFQNNAEEKAKTICFGFEIESKLFRSNSNKAEKKQWKFPKSSGFDEAYCLMSKLNPMGSLSELGIVRKLREDKK